MSNLKQEFDFYLANQKDFVKNYDGKFIVIKKQKVIGIYDNKIQAINESQKENELGTFLVQLVEAGDRAYTQNFHSRVIFQ